MVNKNGSTCPDRVLSTVLLLLLCQTSCPHRNSKSRVAPLRCQDSGPPTRSYTAAAGDVAVRCCCCCGLGTRTHTRTAVVPLTYGWRVYTYHVEGHTKQAAQQAGPDIYRLNSSDRAQTLRNTASYILLQRGFTATPARCWAALYGVGCLSVRAAKNMRLARLLSAVCFMSRQAARS